MKLALSRNNNILALKLFFSVTIMRLVFEYVYTTQISVIYKYSGFLNDFSVFRCIISWFFMYSLIPFIVKCVNEPKFSNMVLYIIYLVNYVPGLILMSHMDIKYILPWYIYYFLLFYFSYYAGFSFISNSHVYMKKSSIYLILAFFSFVVLFIWVYYAHGRIHIGLEDVYSLRLEAREYGMPMILRYIFASMKIVLPVFVVWSLKNKFVLLACLFSLVQLIIFFVDGSKSTLFALFISIVGYFVLRNHVSRIKYFPQFLSLVGVLSILEYKTNLTYYISGIFIRRLMFVPQHLNISYYDFFSTHTPDYFQGSLLKIFGFESQYGSIARTIGWYYSGNPDLAANNGLFSDAYANLGILGVFLMPFFIMILLKTIDSFTKGLSLDSFIGAVVAFSVPLLSASYFTLFLSHGAVALLLLFYFIPRDKVT